MKKFLMVMVLGLVLCGCDNDVNNDNNGDDVANEQLATELYNKYIKYSVETSDYKNMNVNDSSSDVYLIKHAIYNILKDNNVNIEKYLYNSDALSNLDLDLYKNGYKITTSQIKQYILKNFNISRNIDFNNVELNFACDSKISEHYYPNENAYRLIYNLGPWSGCDSEGVYSKIFENEVNENNIIIYTDYLLADYEMSFMCVRSSADNPLSCEKDIPYNEQQQIAGCDGTAKECVLNKYSNYVGKFKHVFTKDSSENYYWVSTNKIN